MTTRREFLKTVASLAAITVVPRHVLGRGYVAVSYTHLDVYKRQVLLLMITLSAPAKTFQLKKKHPKIPVMAEEEISDCRSLT